MDVKGRPAWPGRRRHGGVQIDVLRYSQEWQHILALVWRNLFPTHMSPAQLVQAHCNAGSIYRNDEKFKYSLATPGTQGNPETDTSLLFAPLRLEKHLVLVVSLERLGRSLRDPCRTGQSMRRRNLR